MKVNNKISLSATHIDQNIPVRNFSDTEYYANQGYDLLNYLANSPYYNPNYATYPEGFRSGGTHPIVFTQEGAPDQPSYDIGNLRMGLDADQCSGIFYVNNTTDEVARQFYSNRWGSRQRISINKPRTIGLSLRWRF